MKFRRLDDNLDWTKGDNSMVDNERALYYDIITTLRTFKGECYFDIEMGLNVYNIISVKNLSYGEGLIREVLEKNPKIIKIDKIALRRDEFKTNTYYVDIDLISVYGQILIKEELNLSGKTKEKL